MNPEANSRLGQHNCKNLNRALNSKKTTIVFTVETAVSVVIEIKKSKKTNR